MSNPFVGEIRMFAGNFAPAGWALCNGQLMAINTNVALFSILGTTYGGNGTTNFALPNLQGSVPVHQNGGAAGVAPFGYGFAGGSANVTLNTSQMPAHTHLISASASPATDDDPMNAILAGGLAYTPAANSTTDLAPPATMGGNQPFSVLQPYLCVNFIISLFGIFPSRN